MEMTLQRIKWYRLKTKFSLNELTDLLNSNAYSDVRTLGFVNIEKDFDTITAVFTEFNKKVIELEDPFGNLVTNEIKDFNYIDFSLRLIEDDLYVLSFIEAPKSIKSFINYLSSILEFHLTISQLEIDILKFIEMFKVHHSVNKIDTNKIRLTGVIVNENSKASIELISKTNALDDIDSLINNRNYRLEKIRSVCFVSDEKIKFELSRSGSLSVDEHSRRLFDDILKLYLS
ncbi:hypothetical protein [Aliivibrio fischeri]|uniref:hypothetical protein n=1 Tax=Aliivibrio fischeri TaxID=668 RepID=UPI001F163E55|nr:hypothetical protein [Aliivibrio fischeri]MCE4934261.1 hypothetical protein [Aliivibrio fischeri]